MKRIEFIGLLAAAVSICIILFNTALYFRDAGLNKNLEEMDLALTEGQLNSVIWLNRGSCPDISAKLKYGTLISYGNFTRQREMNCTTGCEIRYQFSNNSSGRLRGKSATLSLMQNGKVALNSKETDLEPQYLEKIMLGHATERSHCQIQKNRPIKTNGR